VNTSNVEAVSVAFPSSTVTKVLIVTQLVAMRVKSWFTTGNPLNASKLMTSSSVESSDEMPGWTSGPAFPENNKI